MGCAGSKKGPLDQGGGAPLPAYARPANEAALEWQWDWPSAVGRPGKWAAGPLMESQLRSRLTFTPTTTIELPSGAVLRLAAVSQRGYYPGQIRKPNQDTFTVSPQASNDCNNYNIRR